MLFLFLKILIVRVLISSFGGKISGSLVAFLFLIVMVITAL